MIFNMAALYRTAIYTEIDRNFDCEWYFSDMKTDIKWMDLSKLKHVTRLKTKFFHSFNWQNRSVKLVFKKDISTIFAIGDPFSISLWAILILNKLLAKKKKVYLWTHGWYGRESKIKITIKRVFFDLSNGVFLYGEYARNIMKRNGCKMDNIWIIHNSLDYNRQLKLREHPIDATIYSSHFQNDYPNLIFIGRITEVKKLHMVIEALGILKNMGLHYNFTIIGSGDKEGYLKNLSETLGVSVWFYGECYDESTNALLLSAADLCVSPGNVGLTAIHSLMFGTPVITHDDFPNQMPEFEAIQKNITGDFFKAGDINSLAEYIRNWFIAHPDREKVRQACYDVIDESWNPQYQMGVLKKHLKV